MSDESVSFNTIYLDKGAVGSSIPADASVFGSQEDYSFLFAQPESQLEAQQPGAASLPVEAEEQSSFIAENGAGADSEPTLPDGNSLIVQPERTRLVGVHTQRKPY